MAHGLTGTSEIQKSNMDLLCSIVWPAIQKMVEEAISQMNPESSSIPSIGSQAPSVVVVEAAVLIEAKWTSMF